jgi:hypothetical protein
MTVKEEPIRGEWAAPIPTVFFSLWVNGRKVASREVYYHGYGSSEPRSNSLFLTGNTLERCRYTAGLFSTDKSEKVGCSSAPFHLATAPIDPLLPSEAEQARVGTFSIAATYSPSFCAAFVKRPEPGSEIKWESLELPVKAQPYFASGDYEPKSDDRSDFVNPHTMVDYFDLWNSSQPGTVVRFFGDWKFFMGDVLFFRYGRAPEEDIKAVRAKVQAPGGGTNYYQKLAADMGWMTLTEKPDVETSWQAFSLEGKTYLLEEPVYQSRSTLYRPRGQNQLEPVCVFQMIEDYF